MAVRTVTAAAVFTAAAAVYVAVLVRQERRLRREAVVQRLMAGCAHRDNEALREQLEGFRLRLGPLLAAPSVAGAGVVVDEYGSRSGCRDEQGSPMEGGSR